MHTYSSTTDGITQIWNVHRLWELAEGLPVFDFPLVPDAWGMNEGAWEFILKEGHDVDMSYPIILSADGHLMDGYHRVAQALHEVRTTIHAVQFKVTPIPDEILDDLLDAPKSP